MFEGDIVEGIANAGKIFSYHLRFNLPHPRLLLGFLTKAMLAKFLFFPPSFL